MPKNYTAEVEELEGSRRAIELTFPAEEVDSELERRLEALRKKAKIQGFRPGRVPLSLIRKMYGKAVLEDIAEDFVHDVYGEILEKHKLRPISKMKITETDYRPGEHLKVRVEFDVLPEIGDIDLSNIEVERINIQVTDEDVEQTLERLRRQEAVLMDIEDGAKVGDIITGTLRELDASGVPLVGFGSREGRIRIPDDKDQPNSIALQLEGAKPGETRRIRYEERVMNPEGEVEPRERLLEVEIKNVQREEIPELDDEFARDVGDFETLDELREKVREDLEERALADTEELFIHNMRDALVKSVDLTLPESMVKKALESAIERERKRNPDRPRSREELERELRPDVIWMLKWALIRDHLVKQLGFEVSDDELDVQIEEMIKASPNFAEEIRARYRSEEERDDLRSDLEETRLMDYLASHVKVKEITTSFYVKKDKQIVTPEGVPPHEEVGEEEDQEAEENSIVAP